MVCGTAVFFMYLYRLFELIQLNGNRTRKYVDGTKTLTRQQYFSSKSKDIFPSYD